MADIFTLDPLAVPYDAVRAVLPNGNSTLDLALAGGPRWNSATPAGTAVTLTYFFSDLAPQYSALPADYSRSSAMAWAGLQEKAVNRALLEYSKVANINFAEVARQADADISFFLSSNFQFSSYDPVPGRTSQKGTSAGDVFLMAQDLYSTQTFQVLHEIAHALGLVDLHETATKPGIQSFGAPDARLLSIADQDFIPKPYMVVTSDAYEYGITPITQPATPMLLDILALQLLYGANTTTATGNDTYSFEVNPDFYRTIWDAGGHDTIDVSNQTNSCYITLVPGTFSTIGLRDPFAGLPDFIRPWALDWAPDINTWNDGTNSLVIAFGAVIEDIIGSGADDVLIGNDAANILTGGGGSDRLDGGAGIDTAAYTGSRAHYGIARMAGGVEITSAAEGKDKLTGIERLTFADTHLALDIDGNAGKVAKLLGAVFGAGSVANKAYAGIGLSLLDDGMSYEQLAQVAVAATGKSDYADIVNLLWTNIMGTSISTGDMGFYRGLLENGLSVGSLTVLAAEASQNIVNIDLVGLAGTGLEYDYV